jgi:hypothetical protein
MINANPKLVQIIKINCLIIIPQHDDFYVVPFEYVKIEEDDGILLHNLVLLVYNIFYVQFGTSHRYYKLLNPSNLQLSTIFF